MPENDGGGIRISAGLRWAIATGLIVALAFGGFVLGRVELMGDKVEDAREEMDEAEKNIRSDVVTHTSDGHPRTTVENMDLKFQATDLKIHEVDLKIAATKERVEEVKDDIKEIQVEQKEFRSEQRETNQKVLLKLDKINGDD